MSSGGWGWWDEEKAAKPWGRQQYRDTTLVYCTFKSVGNEQGQVGCIYSISQGRRGNWDVIRVTW